MATDRDSPLLSFIPLDEAVAPTNGSQPMIGYWWSVCPERGLIMYRKYSPQANLDQRISERLTRSMYPWAEVRLMPAVFIPRRFRHPSEF